MAGTVARHGIEGEERRRDARSDRAHPPALAGPCDATPTTARPRLQTVATMLGAILDRVADLPPVLFACVVLPLALAPIAAGAVALWLALSAIA